MLILLFGVVEIARVFYMYHALQKALRGGAAMIARSPNVNYCEPADPGLTDARNFIVYGNLQGQGTSVIPGLTTDMIQILPERIVAGTTGVIACTCSEEREDPPDPQNCNPLAGARPADFVVFNLGSGFPLALPFPYVSFGSINLNVSVRMPVTGG
jgi:hypothetical protein